MRSIPACTGEPGEADYSAASAQVYPRVYGGTCEAEPCRKHHPGLSPRVRGNRIDSPILRARERSIPACTGEPMLSCSGVEPPRVYPRVYGGTLEVMLPHFSPFGLSPRVRGNPVPYTRALRASRSIPACTGEPPQTQSTPIQRRVYPRGDGGTRLFLP